MMYNKTSNVTRMCIETLRKTRFYSTEQFTNLHHSLDRGIDTHVTYACLA
jgi:hypothetical protein